MRHNEKEKLSNLPSNLENIKQAYYSKMQALTQKLENEKIKQRQRSQNNHSRERSRSKSMTMQTIQKYTNDVKNQASALDDKLSPQRSISPYQRWKLMPR